MKSYLSLIPAYARVHKRQNRMTLLCIILSVFLVTGIFGMADMELRSQKIQAIVSYGNWHIQIRDLSKEDAALIAARPDVTASSWYHVLNYRLKEDYYIGGKRAAVCGIEPSMLTIMEYSLTEGAFPENDSQILLTKAAKDILGLNLGDSILLETPSGESMMFTISGFGMDTQMSAKADAIIAFLPLTSFQHVYQTANETSWDSDLTYYVQFSEHCNIRKSIQNIEEQFGLSKDQIAENTALLGVLGFSRDSYMLGIYLVALLLFFLVLTAGVLMVASSMNSNIAQRTEFFGLLRCLGADEKQIRRFVRLEALNWCKTAIPAGALSGTVAVWILCSALRYLSAQYFSKMPVWGISPIGILVGALVGLATVLLAARTPAKRAARVSPVTAVMGNTDSHQEMKKAANTRLYRIESALGIHHALARKKNFLLISCSFALSITLFLSFYALTAFMSHAIKPLQPYTPDLSVVSPDETCSIDGSLADLLAESPGVKRVYGRRFAYEVPVTIHGQEQTATLFSYDLQQFNWAEESGYVLEGDLSSMLQEENFVLTVHNTDDHPLHTGDVVPTTFGPVTVAGVLSHCPINPGIDHEILICSESTFERLTGETGYTILDIQLTRHATDDDVSRLRDLAGNQVLFSDQRLSNQENRGAYWAFALFLYGFLSIIVLITTFHIINNIRLSVSARMQQYGSMRAIGMSCRQFTKMIAAETGTYAIAGVILGCAMGFPLHWLIYDHLVTARWGTPWSFPLSASILIILVVLTASAMAVSGPARQIKRMSVTDAIHAQ